MMDFSRERFIKDLLTTASIKVSFISKHPLIKLSELVETIGGLWTGEKGPFVKAKVVRSTNFTNDCLFNDTDIVEIEVEESKFAKRTLKKEILLLRSQEVVPSKQLEGLSFLIRMKMFFHSPILPID